MKYYYVAYAFGNIAGQSGNGSFVIGTDKGEFSFKECFEHIKKMHNSFVILNWVEISEQQYHDYVLCARGEH